MSKVVEYKCDLCGFKTHAAIFGVRELPGCDLKEIHKDSAEKHICESCVEAVHALFHRVKLGS